MNRNFTEITEAFDAGYRCGLAETERHAGAVLLGITGCTLLGVAAGLSLAWWVL